MKSKHNIKQGIVQILLDIEPSDLHRIFEWTATELYYVKV